MESRAKFNKYYVPGLFAVAKEAFRRYPDEWKKWMTTRTSQQAYEESGYVSGFGFLKQKPEGTPVNYDERIQGPTKRWVHDTWALGARISQEAIEDVLYGIMKTITKDLGVSAAATRHLLATRMLMTGDVTTYHTAGDGLALFSGGHLRLDGGTWSNLAVAATPTEASLAAAIQNFENITDHRGKRYDQKAKAIICGPVWEFRFEKLLGSEYEPETANNAVNAVKRRRKLDLIIDHEITDNRWFIMGDKDSDIGFIWFDRIKPSISRHGDPDTGDAKFIIRQRHSCECNDPRSMYMIPGA